jgi:hypothetical protein
MASFREFTLVIKTPPHGGVDLFYLWNYMLGILTPICAMADGIPPSAGESTCI